MINKNHPFNSYTRIDEVKSNFTQTSHKKYEIEMNSIAQRAQGGEGLLSQSISVQGLKNPWPRSSPREEREEETERRERADGREGSAHLFPWASSAPSAGLSLFLILQASH
jgi:hypothetical protein